MKIQILHSDWKIVSFDILDLVSLNPEEIELIVLAVAELHFKIFSLNPAWKVKYSDQHSAVDYVRGLIRKGVEGGSVRLSLLLSDDNKVKGCYFFVTCDTKESATNYLVESIKNNYIPTVSVPLNYRNNVAKNIGAIRINILEALNKFPPGSFHIASELFIDKEGIRNTVGKELYRSFSRQFSYHGQGGEIDESDRPILMWTVEGGEMSKIIRGFSRASNPIFGWLSKFGKYSQYLIGMSKSTIVYDDTIIPGMSIPELESIPSTPKIIVGIIGSLSGLNLTMKNDQVYKALLKGEVIPLLQLTLGSTFLDP